jgi:predicted ATP-dependent serine protease
MTWGDRLWREAAREYHEERRNNGNGHAAWSREDRAQWETESGLAARPPATTFTAAELQTMTFPPMKFVLPGLVPEGATLVVSRPKLGKSWMVLDIALAVAAERFTLGELKPVSGDVLYLALEDVRRRLQRRLTRLLPTFGDQWTDRLRFATEWPRAHMGGVAQIEQWIASVAAPRLVIIDTLAQFRQPTTGKSNIYSDDYQAITGLQKLASKHGIGVVIVHHDRKSESGIKRAAAAPISP